MKYKVIKNFTDKHTKQHYEIGSMYSCGKDRFDEIQKAGNFLREIVKEEPKKEIKEAKPKKTEE